MVQTVQCESSRDAALELSERHPFTGPQGRPIGPECRRELARLTPMQEAVLRLRNGIGTERTRTVEELAAILAMSPDEIGKLERGARALVGARPC
jgi:hypothetical protein